MSTVITKRCLSLFIACSLRVFSNYYEYLVRELSSLRSVKFRTIWVRGFSFRCVGRGMRHVVLYLFDPIT